MSVAPRVRAALVIAASMVAIGWLSRAPWTPPAADHGLLRLSWRMRGERIETCRLRTTEELERLPVHMRTDSVCEVHPVAYRLVLQVDAQPADTLHVLPGGARADRPLFVLHDVPLQPGHHRVRVRFERDGDRGHDRGHEGDDVRHDVRDDDRVGARPLVLDTVLAAQAGRIDLVTLDPHARRFILRAPVH